MSKSIPRDICWILKMSHDKELGGEYRITSRDMKEAKDFLFAGGGEIPEPDTLTSHAKNYFQSTFEGWREQNYPLWGLFRNWNAFAPKQVRQKTVKLWKCKCGAEMPESDQYSHECEFRKPASAETVHKVVQEIKSLADQWKVK